MKKKYLLLILFFIISACNSLKEAGQVMRNEKTNSTDEFLVKKRNPLVLPPNYEKIPEPGTIDKKTDIEEKKFKEILKVSENETSSSGTSSAEKSILNRIKK